MAQLAVKRGTCYVEGDFAFEEGRGGGGTLEFYQEEPNKLWRKNIKMMIFVGLSFGKPTPG